MLLMSLNISHWFKMRCLQGLRNRNIYWSFWQLFAKLDLFHKEIKGTVKVYAYSFIHVVFMHICKWKGSKSWEIFTPRKRQLCPAPTFLFLHILFSFFFSFSYSFLHFLLLFLLYSWCPRNLDNLEKMENENGTWIIWKNLVKDFFIDLEKMENDISQIWKVIIFVMKFS